MCLVQVVVIVEFYVILTCLLIVNGRFPVYGEHCTLTKTAALCTITS